MFPDGEGTQLSNVCRVDDVLLFAGVSSSRWNSLLLCTVDVVWCEGTIGVCVSCVRSVYVATCCSVNVLLSEVSLGVFVRSWCSDWLRKKFFPGVRNSSSVSSSS